MGAYQNIANSTAIIRTADGAYIPKPLPVKYIDGTGALITNDGYSQDYQEYINWVAAGNTADPAA